MDDDFCAKMQLPGQRAGSFSEDFREVGPRCSALGRDLGPGLSEEELPVH